MSKEKKTEWSQAFGHNQSTLRGSNPGGRETSFHFSRVKLYVNFGPRLSQTIWDAQFLKVRGTRVYCHLSGVITVSAPRPCMYQDAGEDHALNHWLTTKKCALLKKRTWWRHRNDNSRKHAIMIPSPWKKKCCFTSQLFFFPVRLTRRTLMFAYYSDIHYSKSQPWRFFYRCWYALWRFHIVPTEKPALIWH